MDRLDPLVCHCHAIRESEIRQTLHQENTESVHAVTQKTKAGSGCGACRLRIDRMVKGLPACCDQPCAFCNNCGCIKKFCECFAA